MAVLLGLLVALSYGTGDFFGGIASKRAPATAVVLGSFALSAALLASVTAAWLAVGSPPTPSGTDLALGAATGLVGPVALGLLYHGLATGRMSVVAPITAVVAAAVPVAWGLADGERPGWLAGAGALVALVAVVMISGAPAHDDHPADAPDRPTRDVIGPAVLSGLGFGVIFVLLGSTSEEAGLWPLLVARPLAVVVAGSAVAALAWRRRRPVAAAVVPTRAAWPAVAGAGVLDMTANAIYLAATNAGLLSIVAVLSSLYPAATVVLARVVLGERLHRIQALGLAIALLGVALMAA